MFLLVSLICTTVYVYNIYKYYKYLFCEDCNNFLQW